MKKAKKLLTAVLAGIMLTMFVGCGSKEIVMKDVKAPNGTFQIQANEEWETKDFGLDSYLAVFDDDESDGVLVMQIGKDLGTVTDLDNLASTIEASYDMSDVEDVEIEVAGLNNVAAKSCKLNIEGQKGDGYFVYGETEGSYYTIIYIAPKIGDSEVEYFKNVCASFKEI